MNADIKIKEIAKKFKRKFGTKAKRIDSVDHDCFQIKLNKNITKLDVLNAINKLCKKYNLKTLRTDVPSPSIHNQNGKTVIGVSSIAKVKPFKEVAVVVYFKT